MINRFMFVCCLLLSMSVVFLVFEKFRAEGMMYKMDGQYLELQDKYVQLQQEHESGQMLQSYLNQKIDSLILVKSKKEKRYEKQIDTIYAMPDSIVFGLLAKNLDSLYIHRFNRFIKK